MKRISWKLPVRSIPEFKFYNSRDTSKEKNGQTPININGEYALLNNSYFIGVIGEVNNDNNKKILCFHTTGGNYIPVSYNLTAEVLFNDVIRTFQDEGIELKESETDNPTEDFIPIIGDHNE